jgi:DNA-binding LacI/PurR family transcriptional regulator
MFPGIPVVMMDDEQSGYLAARHLIGLGHRRIVHVTHGGYKDEELPGKYADAKQRCAGYLRAMRESGLKPAVLTFDRTPGTFGLGSNDYTHYCSDLARQLVATPDRCSGITTFNDYTAIGLLHNFTKMGVRVPDDISLVGYDNAEVGALMRPTLTTVAPKLFDIGRMAAQMVLNMMDKQAVEDTTLIPELIVRQSTAARAQ